LTPASIVPSTLYHVSKEARNAKKAAKYAKQTRNAARVTAVATVVTAKDQRRAMRQAQPVKTPAGWYPDPFDGRCVTWFDGARWVPESKRLR
jgi:septal ring factor EnvC (AmiA/AmiB activator)